MENRKEKLHAPRDTSDEYWEQKNAHIQKEFEKWVTQCEIVTENVHYDKQIQKAFRAGWLAKEWDMFREPQDMSQKSENSDISKERVAKDDK